MVARGPAQLGTPPRSAAVRAGSSAPRAQAAGRNPMDVLDRRQPEADRRTPARVVRRLRFAEPNARTRAAAVLAHGTRHRPTDPKGFATTAASFPTQQRRSLARHDACTRA